jgi:WD40 repeat protein
VFLAEINGLEVVRDNQKTFELSTSFGPSAIDARGSLVAVGGEVGCFYHSCALLSINNGDTKDAKVRLYDWDGKSLKETGLLEGNKGPISAIQFSPDGTMVVSGDVSCEFFSLYEGLTPPSRAENYSCLT